MQEGSREEAEEGKVKICAKVNTVWTDGRTATHE
jgi:hypothetical protein